MDEMTADIDCMIRNNINAVRTCHYPDQIPWYYLCDKAGIYVMAETNMESHGTFQKLGAIEPSCSVPCSIPQWREAVVDRARVILKLLKNHTAILFWSLGNESYAGDDYGGDFDDKPSDYEFSGNGIVFADRKEKPAMQEVRYYYGLYR